MLRFLWPLMSMLGVLDIFVLHPGDGFDAPGFWLVPAGAAGTILAVFLRSRSKKYHKSRALSLLLVASWLLTFVAIAGANYGWFTDANTLDALNWVLPAIGLTFVSLSLSFIALKEA